MSLFDADMHHRRSELVPLVGEDVLVEFTLRAVSDCRTFDVYSAGFPERTQVGRYRLVQLGDDYAVVQRESWRFDQKRTLNEFLRGTGKIERYIDQHTVSFDRIKGAAA